MSLVTIDRTLAATKRRAVIKRLIDEGQPRLPDLPAEYTGFHA